MTKNLDVRFAKSIVDYIFRWMATKFLSPEAQYRAGVNLREERAEEPALGARDSGSGTRESSPVASGVNRTDAKIEAARKSEFGALRNQEDAPPCSTCGSIMIRSGSCYKCGNCGTTSGCA